MPTTIETRHMPGNPGVLAYWITGETAADVQAAITTIMDSVGRVGGQCEFRHPVRAHPDHWIGRGYVVGATNVELIDHHRRQRERNRANDRASIAD